ncbi:hypothetical protein Tco_0792682 [Tanacetum coccineum]
MQPVTQPKAPTDLNLKKKKISPSSKPKSSYKVRDTLPKKQAAETQLAEEPVATSDATRSFETPNLAYNDSKEGTSETFYAFADMPAQSNPLGHLHEELRILNTKIDQLESNITKKLTDHIQSSMSSIVADSLKEICLVYSQRL